MFEFLHSPARSDAGPLTNVAASDHFWRSLPRNDPFEAQLSVSEALADVAALKDLNRDHLRAALSLDLRCLKLGEALLVNYAVPGAQLQQLEKRSWQAAFELSRSFAHVYAEVLTRLFSSTPMRGAEGYGPTVMLRLYQHRQLAFLLRPFVVEQVAADSWSDLHAAFRHAQANGMLGPTVKPRRWHEELPGQSTLEREYIYLLLLELFNAGQFSPYDAFWLNKSLPRWCSALTLQKAPGPGTPVQDCFVVDLGSTQGLMRYAGAAPGSLRYLDPAPMLAMLDQEITKRRDGERQAESADSFGCNRQLKLLRKLRTICAPNPGQINRRGERKAAASSVKAVIGLVQIMRMLREEERAKEVVAPPPVPEVEEITITVFGGYTGAASSGPSLTGKGGDGGIPHSVWQLKDRSESGCGLRGLIRDSNRVLPGALVAFRERDDMPWTLGVVRRLQKRIGDRIDIGIEYVGQGPLGVALFDEDGTPSSAAGDKKKNKCPALYLPESPRRPTMPFKTLIVAPRDFKSGRCVRLRSIQGSYTMRMKEPIEEQDDFVWLPFEVAAHQVADAPVKRVSGGND